MKTDPWVYKVAHSHVCCVTGAVCGGVHEVTGSLQPNTVFMEMQMLPFYIC